MMTKSRARSWIEHSKALQFAVMLISMENMSPHAKNKAKRHSQIAAYLRSKYPEVIVEFFRPIWNKQVVRATRRRENEILETGSSNNVELYKNSYYLLNLFSGEYSSEPE